MQAGAVYAGPAAIGSDRDQFLQPENQGVCVPAGAVVQLLDPEAEAQLRRLYLKARYGECAMLRDAAEARRLEKALERPKEG